MTDERERLREALPSIEEVASALYETDPPESWMRTGTDEYRKRATAMLDIIVRDAVGLHDPDHPFPQSCIDPSHAALAHDRPSGHRYDHDGEHMWWLCDPAHDRPSGSGLREALTDALESQNLYHGRHGTTPAGSATAAAILSCLRNHHGIDLAALSGSKPSASADAEVSDPEAVDVGALRSVVEQAARMGSCSQTHHEWIAKAAVAALTEAKPESPQYTPGGLRYPTVGELHGEPSTEPMLRTSRQARGTGMSIDEAWAEAEKALPDDWSFGLTPYWDHGRWFGWEVEAHAATYEFDDNRALSTGTLGAFPDPVTALRALLARLTEAKPETPA